MKTPKSNENEKSSAKKLVQARLPFKVITTTIADDIPKENSSPAQLKKRKLSDKDYDDHESITQKAEKEESQEEQAEECQHKKIKLLAEDCVTVVLSDEEHDESSPNAKKLAAIIKLPFSNKKSKRRKSATTTGEVVSSDDTEKLESAQKRAKVEPTVESKQQTDEQKIENNDEKQQNISDESSDCNTCSSSSSSAEEKDTTINMLTSDQKTADNNNEMTTKENKVKKPLTKKQLDLMERRRQAREDKERKLNEEKLQKQKEKEEREEAKKREREEKEEQKRKEREEREEKKRQEREEKERKRLEEIEAKNEEKRKRTEAKEEERKRKDLEKEEAELKAKKRAEAFTKFFVPKNETNELQDKVEKELTDQLACSPESKQNLAFRPFQVKGGMKLAPICRRQLTKNERESFEQCLQQKDADTDADNLYLKELKMGKHLPLKYSKDEKETNSETGDDDEVFIVDELENDGQAILVESNVPVERMRVKFYKFTENRRPPYYGTWRKSSKFITPRKPFAQDTQTFDYELDSDLEWEEEEPGESLEDSEADEKDKESEENDDYDVDNEWMVPHGHLSEEEMENEEEGVPLGDENTREAQKAKLQILQQEFARDMNKKTKKIQPRLVGCIWVDLQGKQPATCSNIIWHSLNLRAMLCARPPVLEPKPEPEPEEKPTKPMLINESMSHELVRLIHGNSHSKNFLVNEFIAHIEVNDPSVRSGECQRPLKSTVRRKIEKYAEWQAVDDGENSSKKNKQKKRLCWVVKPEILIKKGLENLSFKNEWKYILNPKQQKLKQKHENESAQESSSNETIDKDVDKVESVARKKLLISNFLKKSPVDEIETSAVITLD